MSTARTLVVPPLLQTGLACATPAVLHLALAWPRAADTVQSVDGGEFAMAAVTGALVHPPGYPVVTTWMHAWFRLFGPFDNVTLTYAHLGAVANALALLLWGVVLLRACGHKWLALVLGLVLAIQPSLLHTSTDVDVFPSLHLVTACIALVMSTTAWSLARTVVVCALFGVAGATHPMALCLVPALIVGLYRVRGATGVLVGGAISAAVCLLLFMLLWVRYDSAPTLAFAPLTTWDEWLGYILRRHYGTFQGTANDAAASASILYSVRAHLLPSLFAAFAAVVGARVLWRREASWPLLLNVMAHVLLLLRFRLPGDGIEAVALRFMPQLLFASAWLLAAGLKDWPGFMQKRQLVLVGAALVLVPPLGVLPNTLIAVDAREDRALELYVRRLLDVAPPHAHVFLASDGTIFGAYFLHSALGVRPDLRLHPVSRRTTLPPTDGPWVAGSEVVPPKDVVRRPTALGFRFYRNDEPAPPSIDEVARLILDTCAHFSPALERHARMASPLRPTSVSTLQFWQNGVDGLSHSRHAAAPFAQAAAQALEALDVAAARAHCAQGLAQLEATQANNAANAPPP